MYLFLHELLKDRKGGEIFTLFGGWHFFYIILTAAVITTVLIIQKGKSEQTKEKAVRFFINSAFALYIADFFLMPISQGEINIEKLPFHACTSMCVMCFLSYRVKFLEKHRISFAFLGFLSNTVYLIYPAGVMWFSIHPLSYRVIQTLCFHSAMSIYGALLLIKEYKKIEIKKCYRELGVVLALTLWSLLGNYVYNGSSEGYDHFFNWFFVVQDPFGMFPEKIAPFIMPLLNISLFFGAEMLIHLIVWAAKKRDSRKSGANI